MQKSTDKKMADDKYAHASMLLAIVTAKQHKKCALNTTMMLI